MIVVPYEASHILGIQAQRGQAGAKAFITEEYAKALEGEFAFTAISDDGEVLAVGGIKEIWTDRAMAWSFIDRRAGKHFTAIHKAVKTLLEIVPYRRIEAEVACEFAPGKRWLKMLGFTMEAERMRAALPDGTDSALFAKVK